MTAPLPVELLHLLVPAAEELDLLEQHAAEQLALLEAESEPVAEPAGGEAPPVPTHAQAVAIVQRCLGGTVLEG